MLDQVPRNLIAGDLWQWTRSLADYPAPTWVATYYFENKNKQFNVVGTASGVDHAFALSAALSAEISEGRYQFRVRVTSGASAATLDDGFVMVAADPAAAGTRDTRSWARRTLDALEATIENRASSDQLSMSIAGRSISRLSPVELMAWRTQLRAEVKTEDDSENAGLGRNLKARFGRA